MCADHEVTDDQPCRSCGTPFVAWGELRCDPCRFAKRLPVELCVTSLAPVIGYLYERGFNVFSPSLEGLFDLVQTQVTIAATESPLEVAMTIGSGDDSLTITLDEHLSVVDISQ